jgi:DUF1009 family protein
MSTACGLIAGSGTFPFHVAREAGRQGRRVVAMGLTGWVDPSLREHVAVYEEVSIGQLGELVRRLRAHAVTEAVMAGKVTKGVLLDPSVTFDADAVGVIGRVKEFSVNALLGAIAQYLAEHGVRLLDSSTFLREDLCPAGPITKRPPSPEEQADIDVGVRVARALAQVDVGQSVVVRRTVVVAVEALEGTDAMLRRAGQVGGAGGVLVKMASPSQDRRFDLPVLGPQTVAVAREAGVRCLAVEAGSTLLLDRAALIAAADAADLAVVGVEPSNQTPAEPGRG